jgi:hypothetical protein
MLAAAGFNCRGCELWTSRNQNSECFLVSKPRVTINACPDFGKFMGENRFKEDRKLLATIWERKEAKENDPWWSFFVGSR